MRVDDGVEYGVGSDVWMVSKLAALACLYINLFG